MKSGLDNSNEQIHTINVLRNPISTIHKGRLLAEATRACTANLVISGHHHLMHKRSNNTPDNLNLKHNNHNPNPNHNHNPNPSQHPRQIFLMEILVRSVFQSFKPFYKDTTWITQSV